MPVELDIWAGRLRGELERLEPDLGDEASRLLRVARRYAPGKLGQTLSVERASVVSSVPYAEFTSKGGILRPKRARWLRIPLPGQPRDARDGPDYVTVGERPDTRHVLRRSTGELVAVRKLQVRIRGSGWIPRALAEHEREAERRLEQHGRKVLEGVS